MKFLKGLNFNFELAKKLVNNGELVEALPHVGENIRFVSCHKEIAEEYDIQREKELLEEILNQSEQADIHKIYLDKWAYLRRLERFGCDEYEEHVLALSLASELVAMNYLSLKLGFGLSIDDIRELVTNIIGDEHLSRVEAQIKRNSPNYISILDEGMPEGSS